MGVLRNRGKFVVKDILLFKDLVFIERYFSNLLFNIYLLYL